MMEAWTHKHTDIIKHDHRFETDRQAPPPTLHPKPSHHSFLINHKKTDSPWRFMKRTQLSTTTGICCPELCRTKMGKVICINTILYSIYFNEHRYLRHAKLKQITKKLITEEKQNIRLLQDCKF